MQEQNQEKSKTRSKRKSVIFIIISGIKIVTAAGDEKKLASASQTLTYAIIGLVVTILAFVIVRLVQYFLRSNVAI